MIYDKWIRSFEEIGVHPLSDDTCCKLLAIALVLGGGNEALTHCPKFLADIGYAQRRLHISGGEVPDKELSETFRRYVRELNENEKILWASDLMKRRYDLRIHQG